MRATCLSEREPNVLCEPAGQNARLYKGRDSYQKVGGGTQGGWLRYLVGGCVPDFEVGGRGYKSLPLYSYISGVAG